MRYDINNPDRYKWHKIHREFIAACYCGGVADVAGLTGLALYRGGALVRLFGSE